MIKQKLRSFGLLIFWLSFFYSFSRLYFYLANFNIYKNIESSKIIFAFIHGLRFDFSGFILLNLLFFSYCLIPRPKAFTCKILDRLMALLFFISNGLFIIFNIADAEYYTFSGKRSSLDIFGFSKDMNDQLGNIILSFAPKVLFSVFLAYLFYKFTKKHTYIFLQKTLNVKQQTVFFLVFLVLAVIAARGGLQSKVLRPAHAFIIGSAPLAHLSQNTTFTVLKSKFTNNLERIEFMTDSDARKNINYTFTSSQLKLNPNKQSFNIVLLALEGFSTDYWGHSNKTEGYTPFLDSLAKRGVFFKNHFANGRRSAEAFPAFFMGIPSLGLSPLPMSQYINNEIWGLAHGLQQLGYDSRFFHGANYNSSYTHSSAKISGFSKLTSRDDYPDPKDYNGHWGISDGPFLKFFANEMDQLKEPFVTGVLTLSSHEPFELPAEFENKIPQLEPIILRTVLYTDSQVKEFFGLAKTKKWYKNTLFIITGDHTSQTEEFSNSTSGLGLYRVPMLFFTESEQLKIKAGEIKTRITQHIDLTPTLFDLLGLKEFKLAKFGRSMFADDNEGRVLVRSSQIYRYANSEYILKYFTAKTGREGFEVYKNKDSYIEGKKIDSNNKDIEQLKLEFKSYLQYYNNSMLDNSIYTFGE